MSLLPVTNPTYNRTHNTTKSIQIYTIFNNNYNNKA